MPALSKEMLDKRGETGFIVKDAVCITLFADAAIVAAVGEVTLVVLTVNVAEEEPAVTVTLAGTVADVLLLDKFTTVSLGTFPLNKTVPVEVIPPATLVGENVTLSKATGLTVTIAVLLTPL